MSVQHVSQLENDGTQTASIPQHIFMAKQWGGAGEPRPEGAGAYSYPTHGVIIHKLKPKQSLQCTNERCGTPHTIISCF